MRDGVISTHESFAGFSVQRNLAAVKSFFEAKLAETIPAPQSEFAAGIILGSRQEIAEEILNNFRATGIYHLLALSGFNVTILIFAVFWLFKFLPKKITLILTAVTIILFVILTGSSASVVRAAIMGVVGILVFHSGREISAGDSLLFAVAAMLIFNPRILLSDAGFQLSAIATAALIFFVPLFERSKFFAKIPSFLALRETILISSAAQLAVAPLVAFSFGKFSLAGLIANPLVAPFVAPAMLFSFLAATFGSISILIGKMFGFVAFLFLSAPLKIAEVLARFPFAEIKMEIGFFVFVFWSAGVVFFWKFLREKFPEN